MLEIRVATETGEFRADPEAETRRLLTLIHERINVGVSVGELRESGTVVARFRFTTDDRALSHGGMR